MAENLKLNQNTYTIIESQAAESLQGIIESKIQEVDGRYYKLLTVEGDEDYTQKMVNTALSVLSFVATYGSVAEQESNVQSGKIIKHLAVDLTAEKRITKEALQAGLIPRLLTERGQERVWLTAEFDQDIGFYSSSSSERNLIDAIRERQKEILKTKENYKVKLRRDPYSATNRLDVTEVAQEGTLKLISGGMGGVYLLSSANGTPRFIVKPNDEDSLCVNNPKRFAFPFIGPDIRNRVDIPTYQSAHNEALASDIAELAGLRPVVPVTVMIVIKNDSFHLITDVIPNEYVGELAQKSGREKLCSAQEFVTDSTDLFDFTTQLSKDQQTFKFDPVDFVMAIIFMLIIGDQDGHSGNYRVYKKPSGEIGIKKVDNGLCFGEGSGRLDNCLITFDQIESQLSEQAKEIIRNIPLDQMKERMVFYGKSEQAIAQLEKRVLTMKLVIQENPTITVKQLYTLVKTRIEG